MSESTDTNLVCGGSIRPLAAGSPLHNDGPDIMTDMNHLHVESTTRALDLHQHHMAGLPKIPQTPGGVVTLNEEGQRLQDALVVPPSQPAIQKSTEPPGDVTATVPPCAGNHPWGECDDWCKLTHKPVETALVSTSQWAIRQSDASPTTESYCKSSTRVRGHVYQSPSGEHGGGPMPCNVDASLMGFGASAHMMDPAPAKNALEVVVTGTTVSYSQWNSNTGPLERPVSRRNSSAGSSLHKVWSLGSVSSGKESPQQKSITQKSDAGSWVSRPSTAVSKASPVSWDKEDEFDQVLQTISEKVAEHAVMIRKASPARAKVRRLFSSHGRAQLDCCRDMRKLYRAFQKSIRESLGMSHLKEQTDPLGRRCPAPEYLEARGRSRSPINAQTKADISAQINAIRGYLIFAASYLRIWRV